MEPRDETTDVLNQSGAGTVSSDQLVVSGLQAGYGKKHVVFDVDLHLLPGEIVTIIGHNGAGKTTVLKTIFGMLPALGGTITYSGEDVTTSNCRQNAILGMSYIPAERFVFSDLSVLDNLRLGANHVKSAEERERLSKRVYEMFPLLSERANQLAGTMSGGQQRMVSLGIALMSNPSLLLLDEPSLGLAPALVGEIFDSVRRLADEEGLTVLLIEQNVGQALRIADRAYVLRSGRMILEETAEEMRRRKDYWDLF